MEKSITDPIDQIFRLKPAQRQGLAKLNITSVRDLLYQFPARYELPAREKAIGELRAGEMAAVIGQVKSVKMIKAWRKKIPLAEVIIEDATGRIKAIWFHQAYLAKKIYEEQWVKLSGKLSERKKELYFANPSFEIMMGSDASRLIGAPLFQTAETALALLRPIYSETRGVSSLWFEHSIKQLLLAGWAEKFTDPLPEPLRVRYHLPAIESALALIHQPRNEKDWRAARKRFAFEEIFFIQLTRLNDKNNYQKNAANRLIITAEALATFLRRLPFALTAAQARAIKQIIADLKTDRPMLRLLEGDVGSGKTVVAAAAAYATVQSGFAVAFMAPTEILARQHFISFIKNFPLNQPGIRSINVGLLTAGECLKFPSKIDINKSTHISRPQLLKWVASGEIPILVGTHSLIQKTVTFKNLALAVIDEQHRFGVNQRAALLKKNRQAAPHLLSLTATPIPRTLALTVYGDLDLTLLDELPPGRKPIITEIITEDRRRQAYDKIREEVRADRQCYVICPRIDLPDPAKTLALYAKSAKQEARRLQAEIFPEFTVGLVHSKLKPKDKEAVMADFAAGKIQILVATSVVEVGVNVPQATVIVIEGAERFGLAQLHQLRGRVWRSSDQAYCFLFTDSQTGKTVERLRAIKNAKNGFELAELDLKLRGAGALAGGKQWGLSDLGMETLQNLKMVEAARAEAQNILKIDPALAAYPIIRERLAKLTTTPVHFE